MIQNSGLKQNLGSHYLSQFLRYGPKFWNVILKSMCKKNLMATQGLILFLHWLLSAPWALNTVPDVESERVNKNIKISYQILWGNDSNNEQCDQKGNKSEFKQPPLVAACGNLCCVIFCVMFYPPLNLFIDESHIDVCVESVIQVQPIWRVFIFTIWTVNCSITNLHCTGEYPYA